MPKKKIRGSGAWPQSNAELYGSPRKTTKTRPATVMLIPLMTWAEQNGVLKVTARKYAGAGRITGAIKRGKFWHVPINAKVPEPGQVGNPNFKRMQPATGPQ